MIIFIFVLLFALCASQLSIRNYKKAAADYRTAAETWKAKYKAATGQR